MPTVVQFRRGTTAQNDAFTGAVGEMSYDTEAKTIRVHDGSTQGGFPLETASSTATLTNKTPGQHWVPSANVTYDLGDSAVRWRDLYLSGSSIFLGSLVLKDIAGTFSIQDSAGSALAGSFSSLETTGNLTVGGDLIVNGTTTNINTTNLTVEDKNITIASGAADSAAADGAGITVDGSNAYIIYDAVGDQWNLNKPLGTVTNVIGNYTTTQLTEGNNLYYTRARFDSALGDTISQATIRGYFSAAGDLSYNSSTGEFSFDVENVYTQANFDSDFNTSLDAAAIDGVGLTYNSTTNTLSIDSAELYANFDHDSFRDYVADEHVAHSGVTLTAGTGLNGGGDISSSRTFNIDSAGLYANFAHDAFHDYVANEHVNHGDVSITAGSGLTGGGDITTTRTLNIGQGTGITVGADAISTNDSQIVHDNLSGFVANEHIDHSTVTITAGSGLTGGGDITTTRTLNIGQGTGITVGADSISTNDAQIVHDNLSGFVADEHIAHTNVTLTAGVGLNGGGNITASRTFNIDSAELYANFDHDSFRDYVANEHINHTSVTLTAGSGLTGGGDISASRTFNIGQGTGITVGADAISTNDSQIVHDNLSGFVADEHVAHSGVTLTAGAGLTGGGTIAASRTFNVGAGTGVTVNADNVAIGQDVATTADVTFGSVTTTGNIVVGGNLQVTGTTTTVNSESLQVTDNMIYMNAGESDGSPTQSIDVGWAANVNDGGSYTHVGMFRDATDDRFKVFGAYTPEPDAALEINTGHASFALADFQAATFHGALSGNATTATTLQTARTIALTGDVTATGVSFDGSGNISLTTAMAANSVDLTTHTTGNYVASITNGSYITGGNGGSEGAALTLAVDATSANTASKVVARDGSGNFSAGTITATLNGNASTATSATSATTATTATNVTATANNSTNETTYITFVDGATGAQGIETDTGLTYNPSTGVLTSTTFSGALSGNATTATAWATGRTITLTGDVTGVSGSFDGSGNLSFATSLAANTVTSTELSGAVSLVIYNSAGTALKTLYGAGS